MKEIAVDGCTLKFSGLESGPYSVQDPTDAPGMVPPASLKVKIEGNGVWCDGASYSGIVMAPSPVLGMVNPPTFPISGSFTATAMNTKAEGKAVLVKGDQTAPMVATFVDTNPASGASSTAVFNIIAEIDDPGQTKVKTN